MKRSGKRFLVLLVLLIVILSAVFMYIQNTGDLGKLASTFSQIGASDSSAVPQATATPAPTPTPMFFGQTVKVKGLYLTGWTVGHKNEVDHYVKLANETEINAYVVDIKDDDGKVGYKSEVQQVKDANGWTEKYDPDYVLKTFHENGIYVIGRIVCFKDPVYSKAKPEYAIKNVNGNVWKDNKGLTWLDPYNKESWNYNIEIAKEAVKKGFNEIQFDYVRFANDGDKKLMDFSKYNGKPKYEAINEFLAYAKQELPDVKVSADIFGIVCESPADTEGIGQNLDTVGKNIDAISPMAYPSHYAVGQIINKTKYMKPDLDPYGVVFNTLASAKARIAAIPEYKARVRPYIQDFTAPWLGKGLYQSYGPKQLRDQINAVYDAGYEEWLVWNAGNKYSESALKKEESVKQ